MARPLVVVGAGGFGREVLDVADAINTAASEPVWEILGVVDEQPSQPNIQRLAARDVRYLGILVDIPTHAWVGIGVGSPTARAAIDTQLTASGFRFATLVHPTAVIGSQTTIGEGSVICALACSGTNVSLGRHVHLNPHAVIGHDAVLEDFVSVNPNATISGECVIGSRSLIGASAVVLQQRSLAPEVVVGAGACVTRDVDRASTIRGVPAR